MLDFFGGVGLWALLLDPECEEQYRKLVDAAQNIFGDVRIHLPRAAILAMELEAEQLDWSKGELFTNTGSSEAVKAYHQQVKNYLIKLKGAISRCLHEIA